MKAFAAVILAAGVLAPASAFAIGAIAVDDSVGDRDPAYGFSYGLDSRQAAERKALGYCAQHGDNCKVVVWFETCGAYASSDHYYGYGYGVSKQVAIDDALEMCGHRGCRVVVSACE